MKRSRVIAWGALAVILGAAIVLVAATRRTGLGKTTEEVPSARVKRGNLDLKVHETGELRASHSMTLTAPAVGGDALQITRLLHSGQTVKKGETVMEFDPSQEHYKLEQSRSELLQAEQEITKANADAAVLAAQDKVALLKARFDVRRAELDVQKNELVSAIDGSKNQLALQQAKRVLAELEQDVQSHSAAGQASIYLAQEKHNKAKLEMDQAQQNIEKMQVVSPMDGLVSIEKNMDAAGGLFFTGMSVPHYHAGDQAQAGSAIAQVVDPLSMELTSQVAEENHNNISQGQQAEVQFDALPGKTFHAKVKTIGGMSSRQFWEGNAAGTFDVSLQLLETDPHLRSGLTAQIVFVGDQKRNVLYIPRQALFLKDGKRIAYVKKGNGYEEREVKIRGENESRVSIDGLTTDDEVALMDPTAPRKPASAGPSSPGLAGGAH
jgi:multidrug resistance efflux pump